MDSRGTIYQFSAPQLWRNFDYDELYPGYEEVRAYFDHVDAELGLRVQLETGSQRVERLQHFEPLLRLRRDRAVCGECCWRE